MNRELESEGLADVIGGVDTHLDLHVCVALCSVTLRKLGDASFPVTSDGYERLLRWLESFGPVTRIGVEGTGSYGAGLSRFLSAAGVTVCEVHRPDRSSRRFKGKTDTVDAEAAARAVVSGQGIVVPKAKNGGVEAIRVLRLVYMSAMKDRTAAINQFHAVISTAPEGIREELANYGRDHRIETARRWRYRAGDDQLVMITRMALKELAGRIRVLTEQAARIDNELTALVELAAPALVDLPGVGIHTAAELLMAVGDNADRVTSEAAFAHLCGAAPIPASSGKTNRHRLNYAGNRAANHALWRIAMARLAQRDPRTTEYVRRRTTEGLSKREIIRCLKRYIAREVFRVMMAPPPSAPTGIEIRTLRKAAGMSQSDLAEVSNIPLMQISRIERGLLRNGELQRRCHGFLGARTST